MEAKLLLLNGLKKWSQPYVFRTSFISIRNNQIITQSNLLKPTTIQSLHPTFVSTASNLSELNINKERVQRKG
jgi:hypothetical protein